jgi:hypothetical protein
MLSDFLQLVTVESTGDSDRDTALESIRELITDRFTPDIPDEGSVMPAVSYLQVNRSSGHILEGDSDGLHNSRIQIDIWSLDSDERANLGECFRAALDGFKGTVGSTEFNVVLLDNDIDSYESERKQYRKILDFRVIYN